MEKFILTGPCKRTKGEVKISGAKNSVLALLAASILFNKKVKLENVPFVTDVMTMITLLRILKKYGHLHNKHLPLVVNVLLFLLLMGLETGFIRRG